jgi:dienelactone hydrolase
VSFLWSCVAALMSCLLSSGPDSPPSWSKVLPDPLVLPSGARVSTPGQWLDSARPELIERFGSEVYGKVPETPAPGFRIIDHDPAAMAGKATRKRVAITFPTPDGAIGFEAILFVPNDRPEPAPALVLVNHRGRGNLDPTRGRKSEFWPAEEIVARGYAAVGFHAGDVAPDSRQGFRKGVLGALDPGPYDETSWGALAAWAWGASRVLDYLETDPEIDAQRVAVIGHSRGGKAALWAGARDDRFALTVSNNSGTGGAGFFRGNRVEPLARITRRFPHWFAGRLASYADRPEALPVDQHMLLALMAPRALYVASASRDRTADIGAEWTSARAASQAYALLGRTGLAAPGPSLPEPGAVMHGGMIGYHQRPGRHALLSEDWALIMDFADARLEASRT